MLSAWRKQSSALMRKAKAIHKRVLDLFSHSSTTSVVALSVGAGLVLGSALGLFLAWQRPLVTEASIPLVDYQQDGSWDYQVYLKPNSLYRSSVLASGQTYFTRLVDQVKAEFTYSLVSTPTPKSATYTYQVTASFGSTDLWEKQFTLVTPTTTTAHEFSVPVTIEISEFVNLLQTFHAETGTILFTPQLIIVGQVIPEVETGRGAITTPFRHELHFEFDDEMIQAKGNLEKSQPDVIQHTQLVAHPEVKRARFIWSAVLLSSGTLLGYLILGYRQAKAHLSPLTQDLRMAKKHLRGLLIHTESEIPPRDDQVVVRVESITALVELSEETLRPVTYTTHSEWASFILTDERGGIRYEYISGEDQEDQGAAR